MSLEQFFGFDTGEGGSEAAFEAFKEKMAAAAAQIAAIKKEEGKQKKKEEELLKILLQFIKTSQKKELVLLISRALEQNIPANFILAVILLGNEELDKKVGDYLSLQTSVSADEKALIFFNEDETIPLKIRIELDFWMKTLLYQAEEYPQKLIRTSYDFEILEDEDGSTTQRREIKIVLIQLVAHILRDFLESKNFPADYEKLEQFSQFILNGILTKTEENLMKRKLIK